MHLKELKRKAPAELVAIAEGIGRPARQRSTAYAPLAVDGGALSGAGR